MEAATLDSPQRKPEIAPIQKSLSLPSYAKAGGEGIDHRLIFAALEQKERVRRKSRIFAREKSARQNIFCLPIPSGNKCKETSLSSDTSCSSLEYQKPKPKKEDPNLHQDKRQQPSDIDKNESAAKTNQKPEISSKPSLVHEDVGICTKQSGHRSPVETLRPNVGSSDSMDRSSRSSSDSVSRKERLVAIKARVEAAREKYGESSSEEETSSITRYNSDGIIHRSVREIKSKSMRMEKRLRRRSQDEWALKRANRKNKNLSLCLNPNDDPFRYHLDKPADTSETVNHIECKTDFCPSPNFPDLTKKNYFSDYPSKENVVRVVQSRIRQIEEEEKKRKNSPDIRDKIKACSYQSPLGSGNTSPASTESRNQFPNHNGLNRPGSERNFANAENVSCLSPSPRSSRAPTPPPRSPKSMTVVNKAIIQHQNATLLHYDNRSLERKPFFQPKTSAVASNFPTDRNSSRNDILPEKKVVEYRNDSSEKRKIRESLSSRRKTCGYFDLTEINILDDLISSGVHQSSKSTLDGPKHSLSSHNIETRVESKGYFSGSESPSICKEDIRKNLCKNRWEEIEQKHEFMFNSLESRKKGISPSWLKWKDFPIKNDSCLCKSNAIARDKLICSCNTTASNISSKLYTDSQFLPTKIENTANKMSLNDEESYHSSSRLSKSEANISVLETPKYSTHASETNNKFKSRLYQSTNMKEPVNDTCEALDDTLDKISATANLDSAMEELENVYRSLKYSSDTLSEIISASNSSVIEKELEVPKSESNSFILLNEAKKMLEEVNTYGTKGNVGKLVHDFTYPKDLKSVSKPTAKPPSPVENSISHSLCIDELFNDLTRQLDIEQKLLKESRENRNQTQTSPSQPVKFNKCANRNYVSPLDSLVSIRKELYENLQRNSQSPAPDSILKSDSRSSVKWEDPQNALSKKKYKAVRSLSANLSALMATANSEINSDGANCEVQTSVIETPSPKQYRHMTLEPLKTETKREVCLKQPKASDRMFGMERIQNPKSEEIRHIRVSMDSNVAQSKALFSNSKEYPRLSTAVCRMQASVKSDPPNRFIQENSADGDDILGESRLEKLLNSLLNDVPEPKQSSLLLPKDVGSMTPPPVAPGDFESVKFKRNNLSKMDSYMAKTKNIPSTECRQRSLTPEGFAQRIKNDIRQNNAHLNQMSFIPVYAKKPMCHITKTKNECENLSSQHEDTSQVNIFTSQSTQKNSVDTNERVSSRTVKTHVRRRSVGFEDMTTVTCFGHNFSNDQRCQSAAIQNSNISSTPLTVHSNINSESDFQVSKSENQKCPLNWNTQCASSENENNHTYDRNEKPLQRYKDKSSKRKSSLNRMDFIQQPISNMENAFHQMEPFHKNSSSDEGTEFTQKQHNSEFLTSNSKRKFNTSDTNHEVVKGLEKKVSKIILHQNPVKSILLPRGLQSSPSKLRQHRLKHHASSFTKQKLSHSAGELESLTDVSEVHAENKICFSAQEGDVRLSFSPSKLNKFKSKKKVSQHETIHQACMPENQISEVTNQGSKTLDDSENCVINMPDNDLEGKAKNGSLVNDVSPFSNPVGEKKGTEDNVENTAVRESIEPADDESQVCLDLEVDKSTVKLRNLQISPERDVDIYMSADENEPLSSDSEKRPSSILRKKNSEEKKELHSILKMPPDEKYSRTPPSILKHRESSEEKEVWHQSDLHSILKKSTSEDESCNSGPDIRPILKISTDDDSPNNSVKPRPILKKRTSFSDECCYASFASGELKPILKKKTVTSEEQPKPILKSRRKSEDTRSVSEFIISRPRAYSADMGVKSNHDSQPDVLETRSGDFKRSEHHDL